MAEVVIRLFRLVAVRVHPMIDAERDFPSCSSLNWLSDDRYSPPPKWSSTATPPPHCPSEARGTDVTPNS